MVEGPREPEHYASERLRAALAADPRVSDLSLQVEVVADDVYVMGQVPTEERREAVSAVAAEVLAGYRVHNDIHVIALSDAPAEEQLL